MNIAETLAAMPAEALIDLIRRGLDDDEEAAGAAINHTGRWRWEHDTGDMCNDPECPYGELVDEARPDEAIAGTVLMQVHGYDVKAPWEGGPHIARHDPSRVLADVDSRRRTLVRCEEELLSGIPRLVHFAQETLRDMARPYLDQEAP